MEHIKYNDFNTLSAINNIIKGKICWLLFFLIMVGYLNSYDTGVKENFNLIEFVRNNGYPVEEHIVQTEDGYLLSVFRIPYGRNGTKVNSRPILINHGLMQSAGDFLILGPQKGLGFILADNGYDVWLMNVRGNIFSVNHVSIPESNKREFYNFSWHEIGYYDVPASIDYVLNKTNKEQLHYIGHSQGTTTFFVMNSMRPEYNKKIKVAAMLAPIAYEGNVNAFYRLIAPYFDTIDYFLQQFQVYDLMSITDSMRDYGARCENILYRPICYFIYNFAGGYDNPDQTDIKYFPTITRMTPSNIAFKQGTHYFQLVRLNRFCQFDYGPEQNLQIYGVSQPPDYNLGLITAPVILYVGKNDHFAGVEDVSRLSKALGNQTNIVKIVPHNSWNHFDFLYAKDVVELLYNDMIKTMSMY